MKEIIAQGVGFIGLALFFVSYQQRDKRKLLWIQAGAGMVFAVHFLLLGAMTGMAMNLLEIPRNAVFAQKLSKRGQVLCTAVFMVLFAVLGALTWESPLSLLPTGAMCLSTVVLSLRTTRMIRRFSIPVSLLWMSYNILSSSIAGVLTEAISLTSIIIAIVRFDVLKKRDTGDTMS